MIKVMIVEDEPPIARSIQKLVEEHSSLFQVVCRALNGKRALSFLKDNPVDLVFSDIKMPVMDGIELAKQIGLTYPETIVAIISGYQDFEYARSAMKYGVDNYLLKPVSRTTVGEVLDTVKSVITDRNMRKKRKTVEMAIYNQEQIETDADGLYIVALLCVGPFPLTPDETMDPVRNFYEKANIEARLESMLESDQGFICLSGKTASEKIIVFGSTQPDKTIAMCRRLYEFLINTDDISITMVLKPEPVSISKMGEVTVSLRKALMREIRLFQSQIILDIGFSPKTNRAELRPDGSLHGVSGGLETPLRQPENSSLVAALKTENIDKIRYALKELLDRLMQDGVRQADFMMQLERLSLNYFDGRLSLQQLSKMQTDMQSMVSRILTPLELAGNLAQILYTYAKTENTSEKDNDGALCESVAEFIRSNYRKNITNACIGREFRLSAVQISKKFKDYFGMSISEYVNNFRIETARAIMRNDKQLMMKEVAAMVGYRDPYYFSKIFKKVTGRWPTEYMSNNDQ